MKENKKEPPFLGATGTKNEDALRVFIHRVKEKFVAGPLTVVFLDQSCMDAMRKIDCMPSGSMMIPAWSHLNFGCMNADSDESPFADLTPQKLDILYAENNYDTGIGQVVAISKILSHYQQSGMVVVADGGDGEVARLVAFSALKHFELDGPADPNLAEQLKSNVRSINK